MKNPIKVIKNRSIALENMARELRLKYYWKEFKKRYSNIQLDSRDRKKEAEALIEKEQIIRDLIAGNESKSFLEVGMGPYPNLERMRLVLEKNISYSGCDFEDVCKMQKEHLSAAKLWTPNIHLIPNKVGTYSWSLFEMMKKGDQFDLIYIDGHHTFYVDLPAFLIAHHLLKLGGCLLVDDIDWTITSLLQDMISSFASWKFYFHQYDFSQYDVEQQNTPHIRKIVEEMFIPKLGYQVIKLSKNPFVELRLLKKP